MVGVTYTTESLSALTRAKIAEFGRQVQHMLGGLGSGSGFIHSAVQPPLLMYQAYGAVGWSGGRVKVRVRVNIYTYPPIRV